LTVQLLYLGMDKIILTAILLIGLMGCSKKDDVQGSAQSNQTTTNNSYEANGVLIKSSTTASAGLNKTSNFLSVNLGEIVGNNVETLVLSLQNARVGTFAIKGDADVLQPDYCTGGYTTGLVNDLTAYTSNACNTTINPNLSGYSDGVLKITKLDEVAKLVSGEFSFDACRINNGTIVKIRKGYFTDLPLLITQ
jgi:hypothetical protein